MIGFIRIAVDPVLVHLGPVAVHWYGVMYALAFLVAYRLGVERHLRGRGMDRSQMERVTLWTIAAGLVGARLYYVVQQPLGDYLAHPIRLFAVWEGGMAFFGAILASAAALAFMAHRERLSFWLIFDAGVFFATVGQPIGRIGNLINGDILGRPSTAPWATAYTFHTGIDHCAVLQTGFACGVPYQPAAAYEAIGTLAILGILVLVRRFGPRDGVLAITYVGLYAVSQLVIFQFRASEPVVMLGLKQAQVTAVAILVVLVPALVILRLRDAGPERVRGGPAPPVPPR